MSTPFLDLNRIHQPLEESFVEDLKTIVKASSFINGPHVGRFEEEFAKWVGTKYCVATCSGLSAEVIALRALGLKPGDQVIVPAMTFIASTEAITAAGGVPYLVDVDSSGLADLNQVEEALKKGIRFVLPVHLFGQLMNPIELKTLIQKYNAIVMEDACQAHGAEFGGVRAGTIGAASAFSFYPGKNLGALGDAGALCTNDPELVKVAKALREHGQTQKYFHTYEGYTARMDTLQAAFLSRKLPMMNQWTQQRIDAARYYIQNFSHLNHAKLQSSHVEGQHVYHLFVLLTSKRDELSQALKEKNIGFGYHYPIPIHQLECYKNDSWAKSSFPQSEKYAQQAISLPIFPGITKEEQDRVIDVVRKVC